MLELRPSCEHCNKALPPDSLEARICSFECTFCVACEVRGGAQDHSARAAIACMMRPAPGNVFVALGVLDDDPGVRPAMHIYVGSKAPWVEIADGLPQHAKVGSMEIT